MQASAARSVYCTGQRIQLTPLDADCAIESPRVRSRCVHGVRKTRCCYQCAMCAAASRSQRSSHRALQCYSVHRQLHLAAAHCSGT
eukprot:14843-Heterococcus_DN1.PRE.2